MSPIGWPLYVCVSKRGACSAVIYGAQNIQAYDALGKDKEYSRVSATPKIRLSYE